MNPMEGQVASRRLGRTGLSVPALAFGMMTLGREVDESMSHALLPACLDAGINLFDCANIRPFQPQCCTVRLYVTPLEKMRCIPGESGLRSSQYPSDTSGPCKPGGILKMAPFGKVTSNTGEVARY